MDGCGHWMWVDVDVLNDYLLLLLLLGNCVTGRVRAITIMKLRGESISAGIRRSYGTTRRSIGIFERDALFLNNRLNIGPSSRFIVLMTIYRVHSYNFLLP